jgi:hypothetical protein
MNYMLKCNIDATVNHLTDGIALGLKDDREKRRSGRHSHGCTVLARRPCLPWMCERLCCLDQVGLCWV